MTHMVATTGVRVYVCVCVCMCVCVFPCEVDGWPDKKAEKRWVGCGW